MTDNKIKAVHRQRAALVYIRQSTASQVEHNRESTARQYALAERACDLGWGQRTGNGYRRGPCDNGFHCWQARRL